MPHNEAARRFREQMAEGGLEIVGDTSVASPHVMTIALPKNIDSSALARELADRGLLVAYASDYLHQRNWIQVCHALAHVLAFLIILFVLARHLPGVLANDFWVVVFTGALCGLVNPTIFGTYLLIALNGFGFHWNEAFSSLRIEDYKGFLRLKIDQRGNLTVYPIVVERVPHSDDGELLPRLILWVIRDRGH